jgi:hypothetical protein
MGGTCGMHGRDENTECQIIWKENELLKGLRKEDKIIFQRIYRRRM